jgi:hypothetical protein
MPKPWRVASGLKGRPIVPAKGQRHSTPATWRVGTAASAAGASTVMVSLGALGRGASLTRAAWLGGGAMACVSGNGRVAGCEARRESTATRGPTGFLSRNRSPVWMV